MEKESIEYAQLVSQVLSKLKRQETLVMDAYVSGNGTRVLPDYDEESVILKHLKLIKEVQNFYMGGVA